VTYDCSIEGIHPSSLRAIAGLEHIVAGQDDWTSVQSSLPFNIGRNWHSPSPVTKIPPTPKVPGF